MGGSMLAYEVIDRKVKEIGIPKSELARRVHIDGELLRRSLAGKRKITADEFIRICNEIGLKLEDFKA